MRRGGQLELFVESIDREHVVVDVRGIVGGPTRPSGLAEEFAVNVDDLLAVGASGYTSVLGKLGGR